jgi:hypothetical protein
MYALVLCLTFVACSAAPEKQPSPVAAAFDSFDQFQGMVVRSDLTTRATASKIHDRYRAQFSPYQTSAALSGLSSDDVALLFRAADLVFFLHFGESAAR